MRGTRRREEPPMNICRCFWFMLAVAVVFSIQRGVGLRFTSAEALQDGHGADVKRQAPDRLALSLLPEPANIPEPLAAEPDSSPKTGQLVEWEGWTFKWSIHPRAGVVVTDVGFRGKKVLKYAGLAEIFVPYNRGPPRA